MSVQVWHPDRQVSRSADGRTLRTIGRMPRTRRRMPHPQHCQRGGMTTTAPSPVAAATRIRYGALIVVMLLSFVLVTAEFLPNGVLTEMAASLGVTPGQAGQTVTVTALVGLVVAPTVGIVFPRL